MIDGDGSVELKYWLKFEDKVDGRDTACASVVSHDEILDRPRVIETSTKRGYLHDFSGGKKIEYKARHCGLSIEVARSKWKPRVMITRARLWER